MADNFCKEFTLQKEKDMIEDKTSFFQQFHCQLSQPIVSLKRNPSLK